jgi:hypothetical protein
MEVACSDCGPPRIAILIAILGPLVALAALHVVAVSNRSSQRTPRGDGLFLECALLVLIWS